MTFYDPRYFRMDDCYGYADVYGYGPGYGTYHSGFRPEYIPAPTIVAGAGCGTGACGDRSPCGGGRGPVPDCELSRSNPVGCGSQPCIPPGFTGYQPVMGRPYIYNTPAGTVYSTYYPYGPWTNIPSAPLALPVGLPPPQPFGATPF